MVDTGHLHLVLSEGAGFVEADGLEPRALHCLFGLGADDSYFVEPHEAETVGEVEEDGVGGRETVGDEISKSEDFHDGVDVELEHPGQSGQKDNDAHYEHFHLKEDNLFEKLGLFGDFREDVSDDATPSRTVPHVYHHGQGIFFHCLELRSLVEPVTLLLDLARVDELELGNGHVLAGEADLIDKHLPPDYYRVAGYFFGGDVDVSGY